MTMSLSRSFDAGAGAEKMSVSARDEIRISSKISACSRKQQCGWKTANTERQHRKSIDFLSAFFLTCTREGWLWAVWLSTGAWVAAVDVFSSDFHVHKELSRIKRLVDLLIRFDVPFRRERLKVMSAFGWAASTLLPPRRWQQAIMPINDDRSSMKKPLFSISKA